jgi:circadian clock protein KaiC
MSTGEAESDAAVEPLISMGVAGLDNILGGGLTPDRVYLVEGNPGSGKTTLSLQFLLEGVRRGEPVLYVTLSETKAELIAVARTHGWDAAGINFKELVAEEAELEPENQYTMFHPSEMELGVTTKAILEAVEAVRPRRSAWSSSRRDTGRSVAG